MASSSDLRSDPTNILKFSDPPPSPPDPPPVSDTNLDFDLTDQGNFDAITNCWYEVGKNNKTTKIITHSADKDRVTSTRIDPGKRHNLSSKSQHANGPSNHTTQVTKATSTFQKPRSVVPAKPIANFNPSMKSYRDATSSVVSDRLGMLEFVPPVIVDGKKRARVALEAATEACNNYKNCILLYVVGKRPFYVHLMSYIRRIWIVKGNISVQSRDNGFFLVRFSNPSEFERILNNGPWFFNKQLIIMKSVTTQLKLDKDLLTTMPVWIKLPSLNLQSWGKLAISTIVSVIGNPLYVDDMTVKCTRINYARVLVEINAKDGFPEEVEGEFFDGEVFKQQVLYENPPPLCSKCVCFGHNKEGCPLTMKSVWQVKRKSEGIVSNRDLDGNSNENIHVTNSMNTVNDLQEVEKDNHTSGPPDSPTEKIHFSELSGSDQQIIRDSIYESFGLVLNSSEIGHLQSDTKSPEADLDALRTSSAPIGATRERATSTIGAKDNKDPELPVSTVATKDSSDQNHPTSSQEFTFKTCSDFLDNNVKNNDNLDISMSVQDVDLMQGTGNQSHINFGSPISRSKGKVFNAPPILATVTRTAKSTEQERDEVILELKRLRAARAIRKARELGDENKLSKAQDELTNMQEELKNVVLSEPSALIDMLISELKQLFAYMIDEATYKKLGRPYALSAETSHALQRFAARGDIEKLRMFATARMNEYLEQAKLFDKNPNMTLPSSIEDLKKDIIYQTLLARKDPNRANKPNPAPSSDATAVALKLITTVVIAAVISAVIAAIIAAI